MESFSNPVFPETQKGIRYSQENHSSGNGSINHSIKHEQGSKWLLVDKPTPDPIQQTLHDSIHHVQPSVSTQTVSASIMYPARPGQRFDERSIRAPQPHSPSLSSRKSLVSTLMSTTRYCHASHRPLRSLGTDLPPPFPSTLIRHRQIFVPTKGRLVWVVDDEEDDAIQGDEEDDELQVEEENGEEDLYATEDLHMETKAEAGEEEDGILKEILWRNYKALS